MTRINAFHFSSSATPTSLAREPSRAQSPRPMRGGAVRMGLLLWVVALTAAGAWACGGQTNGSSSSRDGGSTSSSGGSSSGGGSGSGSSGGGSSDGGASDSATTSSSGSSSGSILDSSPPQVGTAACDMHPKDSGPDGVCIICSDGLWHCNGAVYAGCPSDFQPDAACDWTPPPIDVSGWCLVQCPNGQGVVAWACCTPGSPACPNGNGTWTGPFSGACQ